MPETYRVGNLLVSPATALDPYDPRGIVWMFEPPRPSATYVMGVDATVGIPRWNRFMRTANDDEVDNGAIEIIRVGRNGAPDVQVAEYAAPVDAEDLADTVAALGRLYAGSSETGECLAIIEVYPGPGLLTQRRLIDRYNYLNYFQWRYLDTIAPEPTKWLGWYSSSKSVQQLWIRCHRHIALGQFIPKSPWLVEEMRDCEPDLIKMRGKAIAGKKDDRVSAAFFALWAINDWTVQMDFTAHPKVETGPHAPPWQASDISYSRMMEAWEERWDELSQETLR